MTADEIKLLRARLQETQEAFAGRFGVDQSTIHRWETNGVSGLTAVAVEKIISETAPEHASAS